MADYGIRIILMNFCFNWSLDSYISVNNKGILKISQIVENFVHTIFTNFYNQFIFHQVCMAETQCSYMYCSDFCLSVCMTWTAPPPPTPPPTAVTSLSTGKKPVFGYPMLFKAQA
jgi:hypothetical protein